MSTIDWFISNIHSSVWWSFAGALYVAVLLLTAIHTVLNQEREGSAIAWLGVIFLSPGFGLILYWLFGINRIKRRMLRESAAVSESRVGTFPDAVPVTDGHRLIKTGRAIHHDHYVEGNHIDYLLNGDQTYPAMLEAIANANESIFLSSYIFDYDDIGNQFIRALGVAHRRGVLVRVLIDGIGIGYSISWTKTDRALRELGISTARFLPTLSRRGTRFINLRNHRKILSVDGAVAFIGGINIRDNNLVEKTHVGAGAVRDLHFKVTGPVIHQINTVFLEDWQFSCGEDLPLPTLKTTRAGATICRILPDGPDENYLKLQTSLTAAIHAARAHINIVTPYFLPGTVIIQSLKLAVLRGVKVRVVVPQTSNIRIIDWALRANLESLLDAGVEVYFSPPPFDHSKLLLVDDDWALIGSSNWDNRSLQLNFEVNVECCDAEFSSRLQQVLERKMVHSQRVSRQQLQYSLPIRLRNRICRLFSPYL